MSKLQIETDVYNERRYGKPWIAKATFDENGKADKLTFFTHSGV